MIPKVIHYCWFGGKPLTKDAQKCINNWKKICPEYKIVRWDESNFDINCNDFVQQAYKNKAWAFVSDYARLKIIFENGGFYLDIDVELKKTLDSLIVNKCYFGSQQDNGYINTGLGFGAEKGQHILKELLDSYSKLTFEPDQKQDLACPILNTKIFEKYGYIPNNEIVNLKDINVLIYPPKYFDPIAPGFFDNLLCDDTYSIHHYNASWTSNKTKLKRKIINFIGQKNWNNIKKTIKK